ncbi:eCIS core domain-containing protein, partial [Rhodonellum psychrophilum]
KFENAQRMDLEEEEPLQGKFETAQRMELEEEEHQMKSISIQKKENETGLPDNLKNGVENLSGHSLDDVKVHYNSSEPAELKAHAYAKGTDIHLAPGQEKHLPHEAWHVVQQKQGRVKPTLQLKEGININDDAGLEKEADVMGAKSIQLKSENPNSMATAKGEGIKNIVFQRVKVGGDGAGIIFIAARYFNGAFKEAVVVLEQLKESGIDFDSVDKIVEKVHEDPTVANLMGAANVKKELASAKSKEREASNILKNYGNGVFITEFDIENGTWQAIPGREKDDFELLVKIPSYDITFSFHVHPPKFQGQRPIAGEVMRDGKMTGTQTPDNIIDMIGDKKQTPKSW